MASSAGYTSIHRPPDFFGNQKDDERRQDWVLLILNQPISNTALLRSCMKSCAYRICADGGANRLLNAIGSQQGSQLDKESAMREYLPDLIHGDLDSLHDDVRDFYAQRGVPISLDTDQYSTDFQKAMGKIREYASGLERSNEIKSPEHGSKSRRAEYPISVLVFGTISGRMDQGLGLLSEMIRQQRDYPDFRLYLIGESSFSFLLPHGNNIINFSYDVSSTRFFEQQAHEQGSGKFTEGVFTRNVGILPIAGPAVITTKGLEWDVDDWETSMGASISTSNHLIEDVIKIKTNEIVLFTVQTSREGRAE